MYNQKEIYWKPLIDTTDFILTPMYFLLILTFFLFIRNLLYPKDKLMRRYFVLGLTLKMIGAMGVGFVYFFYYGGGDTNEFYNNGITFLFC